MGVPKGKTSKSNKRQRRGEDKLNMPGLSTCPPVSYTHLVGANKYEPNANLTRGQFITILARVSPDAVSDYTAESFDDVKEGDYFYNAVCWGIANEIVNGRSAGKFEPVSYTHLDVYKRQARGWGLPLHRRLLILALRI